MDDFRQSLDTLNNEHEKIGRKLAQVSEELGQFFRGWKTYAAKEREIYGRIDHWGRPILLYVEDGKTQIDNFLDMRQTHLERGSPVDLVHASTGYEALVWIHTGKVWGLISDHLHPGTDGIELVKAAVVLNPLAVVGLYHESQILKSPWYDFCQIKSTSEDLLNLIGIVETKMIQRVRHEISICELLETTPSIIRSGHPSCRAEYKQYLREALSLHHAIDNKPINHFGNLEKAVHSEPIDHRHITTPIFSIGQPHISATSTLIYAAYLSILTASSSSSISSLSPELEYP